MVFSVERQLQPERAANAFEIDCPLTGDRL
jgi:hypothetical protein